ncbi:MAG: ATP-binding cassette domain-containing protein [Ideonella sp.]|nr:ATP-binding cassette domain-containing protein [Ideonella sp.]
MVTPRPPAAREGARNAAAAGGALHLRRVEISIGSRRLVGPLDVLVEPGTCTTLMGPSGCGKSTLLSWLAGALDAAFHARGTVSLGAEDLTALPPERRRLGLLYQDDLLFPHLSVAGNLLFALPASIRGRAARRAAVEQALGGAGLAGFADRDPSTLSGGQRARVALLRTLMAAPRALLLDEPFGKLDAARRHEIREFVFGRAREERLPVLLVTHDAQDARAAGGPVIELAAPGAMEA